MDAYWHDKTGTGTFQWIVGTGNTVEQGLKNFLEHLKTREQVLFDGIEVFDYIHKGKISYFFEAHVYSKLEFFEKKYTEQVNKDA